ncbi:ion transporter [Aldersonia sp. NBC_00410]|uniref:ion transporter n=1 Tax=Aldersonia sp. NBC_00410 TaxID=2975954 RepID=UPI00225036C9|nr:ion transporter [Aldersonia sp. NBC_00410]MCX5043119.1 ion transporter [Aldersonia sp. NBC_00410]
MTEPGARPSRHYPSRPPVTVLDWVMLALALVSTGYLVWITFWTVPERTEQLIFRIDYVVCAIFAAEFLWRWRHVGWNWKFPIVYWYEVIGMIPVAVPWVRSLRLLRVVVIASRLARSADRAIGDQVTNAVISRVTTSVVEVVKRPITIAVLDEVAAVLQTGHYTRNIAAALRENQSELDAMILERIREDPTTGKLRYLPFHDDIVRLVADTVFRIVFEVLDDARTDELVSDLLRENIDQIRATVQGKYDKEGPMAPLHVVGILTPDEAERFR